MPDATVPQASTLATLARLLPHRDLLDIHDALLLQIRQHPWSGDDTTLTYSFCRCPRCDSLDSVRHAVLDWIEHDLWFNREESSYV
jgi:hypothetical protein